MRKNFFNYEQNLTPMNIHQHTVVYTLFDFLNSIQPMSSGLKNHLIQVITIERHKKGDILVSTGEVCNYLYFIKSGLIAGYIREGKRKKCTWFHKEGNVVMSVESFYRRTPSQEDIEVLEDATLVSISFDELEKTYQLFPEFNVHGRMLLQRYYPIWVSMHYSARYNSAIGKFNFFMKMFPDFIGRMPYKSIASFIGISHTYLSQLLNHRDKVSKS